MRAVGVGPIVRRGLSRLVRLPRRVL